jgi:hypothetical protein
MIFSQTKNNMTEERKNLQKEQEALLQKQLEIKAELEKREMGKGLEGTFASINKAEANKEIKTVEDEWEIPSNLHPQVEYDKLIAEIGVLESELQGVKSKIEEKKNSGKARVDQILARKKKKIAIALSEKRKAINVLIQTGKIKKAPITARGYIALSKKQGKKWQKFADEVNPERVFKDTFQEKLIQNLNNLPSTPTEVIDPNSEEPIDIIKEVEGLEALLPPSFQTLALPQKLKVMRDLRQRVVDIVRNDAQTQYSTAMKSKGIFKKLIGGVNKAGNLKDLERDLFKKLLATDEGKEIVKKDAELLVSTVKNRKVSMGMDANGREVPVLNFIDSSAVEKITPKEQEVIETFNSVANNFSKMPYEWGQERKGRNKTQYDATKKLYDKLKSQVLEIKEKREKEAEKGKAFLETVEMDSALQMEQLLNTHPEFEQEFIKLGSDPTFIDKAKQNAANFLQSFTGKGGERAGLMLGGAGLRMAARGAAVLTASTGISLISAPVIGGAVGWFRGKLRAKETLSERQRLARQGVEDTSKERLAIVDATHLTERLEKITSDIEQLLTKTDSSSDLAVQKKIAMLFTRLEHSQGKVEKGQVNFGDTKSALANQLNLVTAINKAASFSAFAYKESGYKNGVEEQKQRMDAWLKTVGNLFAEKASSAQKEFIKEQAKKSAIYGAGFATAGYAVRWFGEQVGWWGHPSTFTAPAQNVPENPSTPNAAGIVSFVHRAKDWMNSVGHSSQETLSTPPSAPTHAIPDDIISKNLRPFDANNIPGSQAVHLGDTPGMPDDIISKNLRPFDANSIPGAQSVHLDNAPDISGIEPATAAAKAIEHVDLNQDAIIHKGEGIENAFIRQIEHNSKLAQDLGFKGDVSDAKALHVFAQTEAHKLAISEGYVEGAKEIRVGTSGIDKVAYEIKIENGHTTVVERSADGSNIFETHHAGDKFETTKNDYEYSDVKHNGAPSVEHASSDVSPSHTPGEDGIRNMSKAVRFDQSHEAIREKILSQIPDNTPSGGASAESAAAAKDATFRTHINEYLRSGSNMSRFRAVNEVYQYNINNLFPGQNDWMRSFGPIYAKNMLASARGPSEMAAQTDFGHMYHYVKMLQDITGLKPRGGFWFREESVPSYIMRALKKAADLNKLDQTILQFKKG